MTNFAATGRSRARNSAPATTSGEKICSSTYPLCLVSSFRYLPASWQTASTSNPFTTAFGSTVIDQLWAAIRATPEAYKAYIPAALRDRPFNDGLVVQALETWASSEAARILVGVFLVAAAIMAVAVVPALALGRGVRRADAKVVEEALGAPG